MNRVYVLTKPLFLFVLFALTCNNNPIKPEDKPGRRDYVWTTDTLWTDDWFGITDIWGSTPNSIWVTASALSSTNRLWYYDGTIWERYNQSLPDGTPYTVFAAYPDEIWIGSGEGTIWRNTGNGWEVFQKISLEGYNGIIIGSIYGTAKNNLYAVGVAETQDGTEYKGIILRYDGKDWKFLNIPNMKVGFHDIKKMSNGKYLIWASNNDNGFVDKLFVFDGISSLKEIYSDYYPGLYEINGEVYITINKKIYKVKNDKLEFWKEFPGTSYYGTMLGRSEKDFFGSGFDGILHYNGTDLQLLYQAQLDLHGNIKRRIVRSRVKKV